MVETGYLVIADVTGYTRFLTGSELDHAEGILADLFEVILARLKSPLALSNIQGDAFFAYASDAALGSPGQILDTIEALYFGFRARLTSIVNNTTCGCRACANAGDLDLKFVVHHGEYVVQALANRSELTGPDVILLHRLLKTDVAERTGIASYALFTGAAVAALGLRELEDEAKPYATEVEEFGRIEGAVLDLGARWAAGEAGREIVVGEDEIVLPPLSRVIPADLETVWATLWDPATRHLRVPIVTAAERVAGDPARVRTGAVDHCAHGKQDVTLRYVDVRPLRHTTIDVEIPLGGKVRYSTLLEPVEAGTRVTIRLGEPKAPNPVVTWLLRTLGAPLNRKAHANFAVELEELARFVAERTTDKAAGSSAAALSEEEIRAAARNVAVAES